MWPIVEENLDCEQEHPLPQLSTFAKGQTPTDERVPRRAGRRIRPKVRRSYCFWQRFREIPQSIPRRATPSNHQEERGFVFLCLLVAVDRQTQTALRISWSGQISWLTWRGGKWNAAFTVILGSISVDKRFPHLHLSSTGLPAYSTPVTVTQ